MDSHTDTHTIIICSSSDPNPDRNERHGRFGNVHNGNGESMALAL